jgi:hypothetical protein
MGKGITIDNTMYPRELKREDTSLVSGGTDVSGIYAVGSDLFLDGKKIATSNAQSGLHDESDGLYFGDVKIGQVVPPQPVTGLWLPPEQAASSYTPYNYAGLIARYDALMAAHPNYITKETYSEQGYDGYTLVHYILAPENYSKTFYIQAGIHGNEHDAPQTILRIVEILCDHTNESAYSRMKPLRDNVRFVILPCVNPWGWDNASMNRPYTNEAGEDVMMNMNRNLDYNQQYGLPQAGTGGDYPWQVPETRHIKSVMESIGLKNIDYVVDEHDGGNVMQHLWMNYNMDGANGPMIRQLVSDLLAYEEENYPQYKDPEKGWVTDHCADSAGYSTGTTPAFGNVTAGLLASSCEYIGGYFGYSFNAEQMTRSLRIRANLLIYAYELTEKGWSINEEEGATRFRWDYPRSMTRNGLRLDGADSRTIVTRGQVYDRWDALAQNYPSIVTKSASLGTNADGDNVYSYTIGNGAKKVVFIGGVLRWSAYHKETEFGIYCLAENLCDPYLRNQSPLLQSLLSGYTIVVLPCIDLTATPHHEQGLNCAALSYKKWEIVDGVCKPTSYATNTAKDVPILLSFLNAHNDAELILGGGEDTSGYLYEEPKYTTEYMTQFILPMNMTAPAWLDDFADYLETERGEDAPSIERTTGKTYADWAFDNLHIPALYLNLKLDQTWDERKQYAQGEEAAGSGGGYFYRNYETGRRIAAIVNIFLSASNSL